MKTKGLIKRVLACACVAITAMTMMASTAFADVGSAMTIAGQPTVIVKVARQLDAETAYTKMLEEHNKTVTTAATALSTSTTYALDSTFGVFGIQFSMTTATNPTANAITIVYDKTNYDLLEPDYQQQAASEAINTITSWGMSAEAQQQIHDKLENNSALNISESVLLTMLFTETKADLATAMKWFQPFQGTVGVILGVGVVILIVLLIASTVFDLVYIGMPMARNALDGKAEENGKPKPFGVSYDAVKVVQEHEGENGNGSGGNIYFSYLKRRIFTYIILAVCILFLISGEISGLIGWLLDLVSGIA